MHLSTDGGYDSSYFGRIGSSSHSSDYGLEKASETDLLCLRAKIVVRVLCLMNSIGRGSSYIIAPRLR
jgi:hypothetical protein